MQHIFPSNTGIVTVNVKDAIYSQINKAKAILTCVMFTLEFIRDGMEVDNHTIYHALWAVDEYALRN